MTIIESPVMLPAVPLIAAAVSLVGKGRPRPWIWTAALLIWIAGTVAALLPSYGLISRGLPPETVMGGWIEPLGIRFRLDGFAWLGSLAVLSIGSLSFVFGLASGERKPEFPILFFFLAASLEGILLTEDLFTLFVFLEIMALCAYVLIGLEKKPAALLSSFRYLILGTVSISLYLVGVYIIYRITGSLSMRTAAHALQEARSGPEQRAVSLAMVCLIAGCGVRAAFFPLHGWLPGAHAEAPTHVSSILSGILPKVPLFALVRILVSLRAETTGPLLLYAGAFTALYGVYKALQQHDMKRLLAFHTVSQMGYIVAGLGAGIGAAAGADYGISRETAQLAFVYYSLAHGAFKALLFMSAGLVITATGERSIYRLRGLTRKLPFVAVLFAAGALSIVGIPPWIGFAGKFLTFKVVTPLPATVMLYLSAAGTAGSFLKLGSIFRPLPKGARAGRGGIDRSGTRTGTPEKTEAQPDPAPIIRRIPVTAYLPPAVLAAVCLVAGIFPYRILWMMGQLLGTGASAGIEPAGLYSAGSVGKTLAVAVAGIPLYAAAMSNTGRRATAYLRARSAGTAADIRGLIVAVAVFWFFAVR